MKTLVSVALLISMFSNAQSTRTLGADFSDDDETAKLQMAVESVTASITLPDYITMIDECPPVENQCNIGACVSFASAYGLCGILSKRENYPITIFNPMHMHNTIKMCHNDCGKCGSQLVYAANHLVFNGVPRMEDFPFKPCNPDECNRPITVVNQTYKLKSVHPLFVQSQSYSYGFKKNKMKYFLAQKKPIVIAMNLDNSFVDASGFNNANDTWNFYNGRFVGGHAMLVVGYDDKRQAFQVMNSWGTDWNVKRNNGDNLPKGYCWIGYDLMDQQCREAFVANLEPGFLTPTNDYFIGTASVSNPANNFKTEKSNDNPEVELFVKNKYQQYGNLRLIPINIDSERNVATISIYTIDNENTPNLNNVFNIKMGEKYSFKINEKTYTFEALFLSRWLGVGRLAVNYRLHIK